jgi:hypothetical protein
MDNGNIHSGAVFAETCRDLHLNIFWYDALNTPSTVTNKILHGFFDPVDAPDDAVWAKENRTPQRIIDVFRAFYHEIMQVDDVGDLEESVLTPAGLTQVFSYPKVTV